MIYNSRTRTPSSQQWL